jgi:hypothetical protein
MALAREEALQKSGWIVSSSMRLSEEITKLRAGTISTQKPASRYARAKASFFSMQL